MGTTRGIYSITRKLMIFHQTTVTGNMIFLSEFLFGDEYF